MLTKALALDLLTAEVKINDCVCMLLVGMMAATDNEDGNPTATAKHIQAFRITVKAAMDFCEPVTEEFGALPLRRSSALMLDWLKCAHCLSERLMDLHMAAYSESMMALSKALEAACPRWGAFCTEAGVADELAKMQLVDNPAISKLPKQTRELSESMNGLKLIASTFGIEQGVHEYPATRDSMRLSLNTFQFAKRTVTVAAAAKILFDASAGLPNIEQVLHFKAALPTGLANRLEEKRATMADVPLGKGIKRQKSANFGAAAAAAAGAMPVKPGDASPAKRQARSADDNTT